MDVRSRILLPQWASALADGAKPFELQKYTTHKYGNAMKFAKPGAVLVVGASGSPTVVAFAVVRLQADLAWEWLHCGFEEHSAWPRLGAWIRCVYEGCDQCGRHALPDGL